MNHTYPMSITFITFTKFLCRQFMHHLSSITIIKLRHQNATDKTELLDHANN